MTAYLVLKSAKFRIKNIYKTSLNNWGNRQATVYIEGLFNHFEGIVSGEVLLTPIPAEFEVEGYLSRYKKHFVYSKTLKSGKIGIVSVLHQRMHQIGRFEEDFKLNR